MKKNRNKFFAYGLIASLILNPVGSSAAVFSADLAAASENAREESLNASYAEIYDPDGFSAGDPEPGVNGADDSGAGYDDEDTGTYDTGYGDGDAGTYDIGDVGTITISGSHVSAYSGCAEFTDQPPTTLNDGYAEYEIDPINYGGGAGIGSGSASGVQKIDIHDCESVCAKGYHGCRERRL